MAYSSVVSLAPPPSPSLRELWARAAVYYGAPKQAIADNRIRPALLAAKAIAALPTSGRACLGVQYVLGRREPAQLDRYVDRTDRAARKRYHVPV